MLTVQDGCYPELSAKFAMRIDKRPTLEEFMSNTWEKFADDVGAWCAWPRRGCPRQIFGYRARAFRGPPL